MINAYACVASSSSSATASPPAQALCAAAPARPCCNTRAAAHLGPARGITSGSGSLNLSYFFVRGHTPLDYLWEIPRTTRPQSSSTVGLSLWVTRAPLDRNPCAAGTFQKTLGHTRRRALTAREGPGARAAQPRCPRPMARCRCQGRTPHAP